MIGILWFVIIMIIVARYVSAAKSSGRGSGTAGNRNSPQAQGKWTGQVPQTQGKWSGQAPQPVQPKNAAYGQPARSAQPKNVAYSQPKSPAQPKGGHTRPAQPNDKRYAMPARPGQSSAYPAKNQNKTENAILQKARANASEHFDGDALEQRGAAKLERVPQGSEIMRDKALERHVHSAHEDGHAAELRNQPGVDDFDTYHLVEEVNDLIVKGYSGNLEFERDFLAEGMEMLNRISM